MFSKKKKIIILSVMVALLVLTGYLNIALNNNVTETVKTGGNIMSFYDSYRLDRQTSRETAILYYDSIIADSASSSEAKTLAEQSRFKLIQAMEAELLIEGLIKAAGFKDVVLTTTSDNIMVVLKASVSDLTDAQIATVATIVTEQTGKPLTSIRIVPSE